MVFALYIISGEMFYALDICIDDGFRVCFDDDADGLWWISTKLWFGYGSL